MERAAASASEREKGEGEMDGIPSTAMRPVASAEAFSRP